ncbi:MAG: Dabb family protein [Spirochaetales bacterium]|nr:Dabb family protein [Spirochaetales bacterium]
MIQYMFIAEVAGSKEDREAALALIRRFPDEIPGIIDFTAGLNEIGQQRLNWGVSIRFKDKAAWETYKTHPVHINATNKYGYLVKDSSTIEYEIS